MKKRGSGFIPLILGLIAVGLYTYFIPPDSYVYIGILIFLLAVLGMKAVAVFSGDRTAQYLSAVFIVIFLSLQSTIGFNVLNTILLASFIIGIGIFTKQK